MSPKDENKNAKNKKRSSNTKKDENEIVLLEYMEDVDDINCLKNTVAVKILTVLKTNLIVQQMKKIKKK